MGAKNGFVARWREKGTWPFLKLGFERVVPPSVLGWGSIVILSVPLPGKIPSTEGFDEVRWGGPDDVERMSQLGVPAQVLRERLRRGAKVVIREQEERVMAYHWYDGRTFEMLRFVVHMAPGDLYAYDALTLRGARSRGLFPATFGWAKRDLHAEGYERALTAVMSTNRKSMRLCLRQGWREIERIRYVSVLGFTLARADGRWWWGRTGGARKLEVSIAGIRAVGRKVPRSAHA